MALVLEALGSAVLFVTFFVPVSLGPLEGANALAFGAVGLGKICTGGCLFSEWQKIHGSQKRKQS